MLRQKKRFKSRIHTLEHKRFIKILKRKAILKSKFAEKLGMSPQAFSNKIRRWNWNFLEKKAIAELLEVEPNKIWVE